MHIALKGKTSRRNACRPTIRTNHHQAPPYRIRSFDGKVRYLVWIGATKEQIQREAAECGFHDCILRDTFEEAMDTCVELANPGDAVLLSPACASWGMFPNYEVRGDEFKKYVLAL